MKDSELADLATAAECTQGSRVGEAYLQGKREKRTRVRQVMDAAHFNPARDFGASKSQGKKKGSSRETFKNRMNQRMLVWVDGIETRVEAGVDEKGSELGKAITQALKYPPKVIGKKETKLVTSSHFLNNKEVKAEPYLIKNSLFT